MTPDAALIRAAVLVPVLSRGGSDHVVLIQRSQSAPVHRGDIAYPGGRYDPARDDSLLATALREAEEEIGLRAVDVELTGALPEVRTVTSNFLIAPFVGRIVRPIELRPDPREVAAVFVVPLAELRAPYALRRVRRHLSSGAEVEVPGFIFGEQIIWGATHRITEELLRMLPATRQCQP